MTDNADKEDPKTNPAKNPPREFAIIKFPGKTRKHDPTRIPVRVGGERMLMKRMEFIPIHVKFIKALRNATEPVVEEEDSSGDAIDAVRRRKVVDHAPRFPFELVGWIVEKDYKKLRKIALKQSITQAEVDKVIYG
ncbi:MAG TPA: hypothetical protein VMW06_03355 [Desulfobacterales bacterium]|nr:hypothetical protein [Desulfobacterales bacterium]